MADTKERDLVLLEEDVSPSFRRRERREDELLEQAIRDTQDRIRKSVSKKARKMRVTDVLDAGPYKKRDQISN